MSSDLEWYLDVGGKQSGPLAAKEIVDMVRTGKIPATAQVTAARMGGDWVTAQDLIDAYQELYVKPTPGHERAAFATGSAPNDPNFRAPPRPTEQLEKSKIFTLNREDLDKAPDPTEALFQAIQAVREKAAQKSANVSTSTAAAAREAFAANSGSRIPPQLLLILVLAAIFGLTVYGFTKVVGGKNSEPPAVAKAPAANPARPVEPPPVLPPTDTTRLLDDRGGGTAAARPAPVTPPVQRVAPRVYPTRSARRSDPLGTAGGARYRDDRDPPEDDPEVDEADFEPNRDNPEPIPVDPSQIPADRIIPEPRTGSGGDGLSGEIEPRVPPRELTQ